MTKSELMHEEYRDSRIVIDDTLHWYVKFRLRGSGPVSRVLSEHSHKTELVVIDSRDNAWRISEHAEQFSLYQCTNSANHQENDERFDFEKVLSDSKDSTFKQAITSSEQLNKHINKIDELFSGELLAIRESRHEGRIQKTAVNDEVVSHMLLITDAEGGHVGLALPVVDPQSPDSYPAKCMEQLSPAIKKAFELDLNDLYRHKVLQLRSL